MVRRLFAISVAKNYHPDSHQLAQFKAKEPQSALLKNKINVVNCTSPISSLTTSSSQLEESTQRMNGDHDRILCTNFHILELRNAGNPDELQG